MKTKLSCLIVLFLFVSNVFAQNEDITLKVENMPVQDVFNTVQDESGYRFLYSDDMIDQNKSVSFDVNNVGIQRILDELKAQTGLSFRLMEDNLIVVVPSGATTQSVVITGRVTSANDPAGLPG